MQQPIGIFDSGVGGTSIWKEIQKMLPNEDVIYLADSKNAPYGTKPKEEILRLSIKNTELLLEKACKLIVVACNTATTNAIDYLRTTYEVPFVGIEPAIKPAALKTKTKKVGVLATKGTLSSSLFHNTSKLHASGIEVIEREGTGLVDLIESGQVDSTETYLLLQKYIAPMLEAGIDCLVLGCTHYPYLIPQIKKIVPPNLNIIDSGEAVARQTRAVLEQQNLVAISRKSPSEHQFYTNRELEILESFVKGPNIKTDFIVF
ncbi:glutamate racemase [Flagellimonas eckloniae]|uniref:Glutamate racemase n=1 Tax=Flagellimonas eckloniae TaxID=346185 RepID=A0A0Q0XLL0_9FLAO|nr:glutamate racemase [Allomuricauda eckloniae]KQC29906.1 glutamate racemase [Allomuricauda eckloniae]